MSHRANEGVSHRVNGGVSDGCAAGRHVFTVDVEDWFQVENLKQRVSRADWESLPRRVVENTEAILRILREAGDTRATFFILGWVAEREPELVRRIAAAGHEVASHGYNHELVYEQSEAAFRADVRASRELLQRLSGQAVVGYRAPSFSITEAGLRILAEEGFVYDSSWFPAAAHDRYSRLDLSGAGVAAEGAGAVESAVAASGGGRETGGSVFRLANGLWELPLTTVDVAGSALAWSGGGYFRLIPYPLYRWGFARAARQRGAARQRETARQGGAALRDAGSCVFYLHPWEVDAGQPRVRGLRPGYRFRHYVGLARTAGRLERLVRDFAFCTARELLEAAGGVSGADEPAADAGASGDDVRGEDRG